MHAYAALLPCSLIVTHFALQAIIELLNTQASEAATFKGARGELGEIDFGKIKHFSDCQSMPLLFPRTVFYLLFVAFCITWSF